MRLSIVLGQPDCSAVSGAALAPSTGLTTALLAEGHDVTVHTAQTDTDNGSLGAFTAHLQSTWQLTRPDVVHAQSWVAGMAAQVAARPHGIPVVQSFGTVADESESDQARRLMPVLARRAAWMAAKSTDELFELVRMGCVRSRLSVIPAGVDTDAFTPPGRTAPRTGKAHRIVTVFSQTGEIDLDTPIRALTALPDTEFVIGVGSPSVPAVAAQVGKAAHAAGVAGRVSVVEVTGPADVAALLRSADAAVCTARVESTGEAALMAMACGVPVIATAVGALVDIVVDEVTGRLVPVGNVGRFADVTRRMLHEPFAGRGMGGAGRDRARSRYSWQRVAADAVRAYSGAMNGAGIVPA